jgi:nucleoside 2-deoxyribosyltransferase
MKKIYLAGPEVFLPNALSVLEQRKDLCRKYGFEGITPFDSQVPDGLIGLEKAKTIFENNKALILQSDIVLANCNPFRGANVDDGTAFEIGFGFGVRKKIFGYCDSKKSLVEITHSKIRYSTHSSGYSIDEDGYLINEDFGNTINLMLEFSILESGGQLVEGNLETALVMIQKSYNL